MSSASSGFPLLQVRSATPIAGLHPGLPDQHVIAVTGEVTLVWPYNSATKSLAFLLADPDVRLRRDKGQVRIQLLGASAKAVADIRLGAGDTVALALDGVEWVKDNSIVRIPGSRVDWQLQFSEKLILQARIGDQRELKDLNVDHPERELPPPAVEPTRSAAEESLTTPAPTNGEPTMPVINPITMELEEYPSPAFIKRARLSYGALFEGGDDNFEEDGGVKGRGRKRTRFGRNSSSWRYASQSPSPTPEAEPEASPQTAEAAVEVDLTKPSPPRPAMADEGCQTMDIDTAPTQGGSPGVSAPSGEGRQIEAEPSSPSKDQPTQAVRSPRTQLPVGRQEEEPSRKSPVSNQAEPDKLPTESKAATAPSRFGGNTLFGTFGTNDSGYDRPRFGTATPAEGSGRLDIANQVRFGFSHTPQAAHPQQPQPQTAYTNQSQNPAHSAPPPQEDANGSAGSHLEPSDPSKYADMETYVDQAEQEMETEPPHAYDGRDLNPPASESFGEGQFDIATQAQGYNPVEGGHFGADALDEGTRITTDGYAIHNDEINVDKVPPGFASFGGGHENEIEEEDLEEEDDEEQPHIPGQDFVENDELEDELDDEVAVDDRDDTEYGPDGEIFEQGDYDQREYNIPGGEEDDDELSEEEHPDELQAMAQINAPDVIDEDELYNRVDDEQSDEGEEEQSGDDDGQGSYDGEEEGFEEGDEEGSFDDDEGSTEGSYYDEQEAIHDNASRTWVSRGQAQMQPAAAHAPPSAPKAPVVIDLLSDSEDDDVEPPPNPPKQALPVPSEPRDDFVPEPSEPAKHDPTPTRQNLSTGDQHDAVLEPSPAPEQHPIPHHRERRKSHLYGEHTDERPDDSDTELHLPSTPSPEKEKVSARAAISNAGGPISLNDAKDATSEVFEDDDNAASSIPGLNGAADSREVERDAGPTGTASQGQIGEDDSAVIASSVLRSVPNQQENATSSPEASKDDQILPSQENHASEDQEMAEVATQHVASPLRSLGDADEAEAGPGSADVAGRDATEIDRLFEEPQPDQDITMGFDQGDQAPAQDSTEPPKAGSLQVDEAADIHEGHVITEVQETDREAVNSAGGKNGQPQNAPSSPLSFASQVFASSPTKEENLGHLPTPVETQPSHAFVSQASASDIAQLRSGSGGELGEAPGLGMETTVETHVQVEQQVAVPTGEDDDVINNPDVDMTDARAEDDVAPSLDAEQPSTATYVLDSEDEMEIENQIEAQLQFELVRTTVQEGQDRVTVVQESTQVAVSQVSTEGVAGTEAPPVLDQEPPRPVEDIPVEPASLDDAIQEELALQDTVDDEIASEFGAGGDTAKAGDDEAAKVGDDDDAEEDDEMEDLAGEEVAEEVDTEVADVEEEPLQEESSAPEDIQEEVSQGAPVLDLEPGQHGPPQLEPADTVESSIGVLPDDDEVVLVGEADATQTGTNPVAPQEEDLVPMDEENPPGQPEVKDRDEVPASAAHQKPKQELEVLIRPRTRSRKARDLQRQSEEAAPHDDASARQTTKELSPDVSKALRRAAGGPKRSTRASKETRDPSIELAKATIQKRGAGRNRLEPVALEPRRTRQRSTSLQGAASSKLAAASEVEAEEEDSSVALAKAAMESPSKKHDSPAEEPTSRADLVRRLRLTLTDFTPLKSLRHHKKGHPHILAVVACDPPEPLRTKHRDYHTTITVTDASVAPDQVVEVQFSEMHKAYLPAVKQGDTIVLRNFEVVSLPGREFALRQREEESSWAVYEADYEVPGGKGGADFEMQQAVKDYLRDLRAWYGDLDVLDREKLVTAVTKLAETTCGESVDG